MSFFQVRQCDMKTFSHLSRITVLVLLASASGSIANAQNGPQLYQKHCAMCHEGAAVTRAPARAVLSQMSPEVILSALENGTMKQQGAALTPDERKAISVYLSGKSFSSNTTRVGYCSNSPGISPKSSANWNGWGVDVANSRFQPSPTGINEQTVSRLKLRWAFAFPGTVVAYGQPTVVNGKIYVGSANRSVYALSAETGCILWEFKADSPVRAAVTIGKAGTREAAFIGDQRAFVYAVDTGTGELIWKIRADDQTVSRITGAPVLHKGRLFVPVSMPEDGLATNPKYECCKLRSNIVSIEAATGRVLWKTYTVTEEPHPTTRNKIGTQLWGPSGASVWSAPTIDEKRNVLYVGTGDNHSHPTTKTSDAILALNLDSGKIVWSTQLAEGDAFNVACVRVDQTNCPEPPGPDSDFGASSILVEIGGGKRLLLAGQKSGVVHALDPDQSGKIVWQTRIGKGGLLGGIQWGMAVDQRRVYAALSDISFPPSSTAGGALTPLPDVGGGLFALDIKSGHKIWNALPIPCGDRKNCSPAQSAAISVIPGIVFSGSLDGHLRAYSTKDGKIIWDFDSEREYETVNGLKARGGSMDAAGPVIANGMLFVNSGYGYWGGAPGNVLLAFSLDGR